MKRIVIIAAALAATLSTAAGDELVVKVGKIYSKLGHIFVPVEVQNNDKDRTGINSIQVECALFLEGEHVGQAIALIDAAPRELVYGEALGEPGKVNSVKCRAR